MGVGVAAVMVVGVAPAVVRGMMVVVFMIVLPERGFSGRIGSARITWAQGLKLKLTGKIYKGRKPTGNHGYKTRPLVATRRASVRFGLIRYGTVRFGRFGFFS